MSARKTVSPAAIVCPGMTDTAVRRFGPDVVDIYASAVAPARDAPLVVKIGHADVSVRSMENAEADGRDAHGAFDAITMAIVVRRQMAPAQQAETLIHELIHACFEAYQIKRTALSEEDVATRLAPALATVLRDNPSLPALLLQGLTGQAIFVAPVTA